MSTATKPGSVGREETKRERYERRAEMATPKLTAARSPSKMAGSDKQDSRRDVGKKTKRPTKPKTETERFAVYLASLLAERGWTSQKFADECTAAKLSVKEHTVRSWLRGENMPKAHQLRPLGKVLGLADPRHILPPS